MSCRTCGSSTPRGLTTASRGNISPHPPALIAGPDGDDEVLTNQQVLSLVSLTRGLVDGRLADSPGVEHDGGPKVKW